jgi:translation initiation factor 2B subunit (eIF-2B alpha/beta/delta family)
MERKISERGTSKNAPDRLNVRVDQMAHEIVFRKVTSPLEIATKLFTLFDKVLDEADWNKPEDLLQIFKTIGEKLTRKDRLNFIVRNCSERMIRIVKVRIEKLSEEENWGDELISKRIDRSLTKD